MSNRFKPKFNVRKGDTVVVIAGDDKDVKKPRKVLEVFLLIKVVYLVEGVNIITKHTKPSARDTKGGIVKKKHLYIFPMYNYGILKAVAGAKVKRTRENGKLVRVSKKSGEVIK